MKKLLAILLSVLMLAGVLALPVTVGAQVQTKSIMFTDYSELGIAAPEDTYPWNHYVVSQFDDGDIVYDTYNGAEFYPESNTLVLSDFTYNGEHNCSLQILGMGKITVKVEGNCQISNMEIIRSDVTITGSGTLNINDPVEGDYWTGTAVRVSNGTLKIASDATVHIINNPDVPEQYEITPMLMSFEWASQDSSPSDVFSYYGDASTEPQWQSEPYEEVYKKFTMLGDEISFYPKGNEEQPQNDDIRVSLYYAPTDEELAAGYKYSILMKRGDDTAWTTGNSAYSYGTMATCKGREIFGYRSSFEFATTPELWVQRYKNDNGEYVDCGKAVTLTNVDLREIGDKVICPDGSLAELDKHTYTFAYAPTDNELSNDDYYFTVSVSNDLWDYETIEKEIPAPKTLKYYAVTANDNTGGTEYRKAGVVKMELNFTSSKELTFHIKKKSGNYDNTINFRDVDFDDYNGMVALPDETVTNLNVFENIEEDDSEGIAPPPGSTEIEKPDPSDFDDPETPFGYISAEIGDDRTEIVNLFHSEEVHPYKGLSYDLKTNTLTINNVNEPDLALGFDGMQHIKLNIVGTNVISEMWFAGAYPEFVGSGSITIKQPLSNYVDAEVIEAGVMPIKIGKDVTVKLNGGSEGCATLSVGSYTPEYDESKLISYDGGVSEKPKWELQSKEGGISGNWSTVNSIRVRTKFAAESIVKLNNDTEKRYFVKSLRNVGYNPYNACHYYQIVEKDGYWYELGYGDNYWGKDYMFTPLTVEELNELPDTLVDSDGIATAYLATQRDYDNYGYVKDNKLFVFSSEGRARNLLMYPDYPQISFYGNDVSPKMMFRAVKQIDGYTLVRPEEEFETIDEGYDKQAEFLKTKGYEKYMKSVCYPYSFEYTLTNNSITFGSFDAPTESTAATSPQETTEATEATTKAQEPTEATEATTMAQEPTEATEATAETQIITKATEPIATKPIATEPIATEPIATEPIATEPETTEPAATEPETTVPNEDVKTDITKAVVSGVKNKTFIDKAITQEITLTYQGRTLEEGTHYKVSYKKNKNAGKATVTITGINTCEGVITKSFIIYKAANPMTVKVKSKSVEAYAIKKNKKTVKNAVIVKSSKGKVVYSIAKKKDKKKFSVSKKGVITIKKRSYKKNSTIKVKLKITAKGNNNYKSIVKTVTVKIRVK